MEPKDRIILPLDTDSSERAFQLVRDLKDHVGLFKVGLTLFSKYGPDIVQSIQKEVGDRIFLDLKFHDIPQTVRTATRALMEACGGVRFLTVHTVQGGDLVRAAVEGSKGDAQVLGVTVLTSISEADQEKLGVQGSVTDRVLVLSQIARDAGCAGVVCSANEAQAVKKEHGRDFIVVTPGIRPNWSHVARDDQSRSHTRQPQHRKNRRDDTAPGQCKETSGHSCSVCLHLFVPLCATLKT